MLGEFENCALPGDVWILWGVRGGNAGAPFAPVAVVVQHALPGEFLETVPWRDAVDVDWFVCPVAGEAQIAPRPDRGATAVTRRRQDGVELVERQFLDRIALIDREAKSVQEPEMAVAAAGDRYAERFVAEGIAESCHGR